MIRYFMVNDYKKPLHNEGQKLNSIKTRIASATREMLVDLNIERIEVFNMCGEKHLNNAGVIGKKIIIYNNGTMKGAGNNLIIEQPELINGIENDFTTFLSPYGSEVVITSEKGIPLAEWFETTHELNILFNLLENYDDNKNKIYKFIMSELNRLVWFQKILENSWKYTKNKENLTNNIITQLKTQNMNKIQNDIQETQRIGIKISEYKNEIKQLSDKLAQKRRQIESEQTNTNNVSDFIIKDLDLIINLETVSDIHIRNNKFIIYTNPLIIYATNGDKYYGGKYRIELNIDHADVTFHAMENNTKKGYWTDKDPHPHVNGDNGSPCFGNVASTIAELCSQSQIYALTLVCIDFLQSVNMNDAAGIKVRNWDIIDENGNIVETEPEVTELSFSSENNNSFTCAECGGYYDGEERNNVYDDIEIVNGEDELVGQHVVCDGCCADYYYFNHDVDALIRIP